LPLERLDEFGSVCVRDYARIIAGYGLVSLAEPVNSPLPDVFAHFLR